MRCGRWRWRAWYVWTWLWYDSENRFWFIMIVASALIMGVTLFGLWGAGFFDDRTL